jgi:hypothetical protein
MNRVLFMCVLLVGVVFACSDDTTPVPDKGAHADMAQADTGPDSDQGSVTDKGPDDTSKPQEGGAVTCTTGGDECSATAALTCECCGSGGPGPICLCSKKCATDSDCQGSGLPLCNKATGSDAGICTPTGHNCCWSCQ